METVEDKHSKVGRPSKTIKKDIRIAIRFSKTEYFIVQTKASKVGLKISAYVREAAVNTEINSRLNEEERQLVRQLIGMSNNINQLAKTAHKEGMLSAMQYFETFKSAVDDFLNRFRHA